MKNFCTICNYQYIYFVMIQYQSLLRQCGSAFTVWVLCLDKESERFFRKEDIAAIRPVFWQEIGDTHYRAKRSIYREYPSVFAFLSKPVLLLYLLQEKDVSVLLYLDSDILCFHSPQDVFDRLLEKNDICLTPHHFQEGYRELESRVGKYNAGFIGVSRRATDFLTWWRDNCFQDCSYVNMESGRSFVDQGYLNEVPGTFSSVRECAREYNCAAWNIGTDSIERKNDVLSLAGKAVIFFHFCALRLDNWEICEYPRDYQTLKQQVEPVYAEMKQLLKEIRQRYARHYGFDRRMFSFLENDDMLWDFIFEKERYVAARLNFVYNYASYLQKENKKEKSERIFKALSECPVLMPDTLRAGAYFHCGSIYLEENNLAEAQTALQRCIEIIPDHEAARSALERLPAEKIGYSD